MSKKSNLPLEKEYKAGYGESFVIFPYLIQRIEGKILTLVETLGLHESQEKATKDMARDIVQGLYREAEWLPANLTTIILNEKYILKENGELPPSLPPSHTSPFN